MTSLRHRLRKLEAGTPTVGNLVIGRAPVSWSDEQCREHCAKELPDLFGKEDFDLDVQREPNLKEFQFIFAGSREKLDRLLEEIGKQGRKITDDENNVVSSKEGLRK